jgi:hypothetical protein
MIHGQSPILPIIYAFCIFIDHRSNMRRAPLADQARMGMMGHDVSGFSELG